MHMPGRDLQKHEIALPAKCGVELNDSWQLLRSKAGGQQLSLRANPPNPAISPLPVSANLHHWRAVVNHQNIFPSLTPQAPCPSLKKLSHAICHCESLRQTNIQHNSYGPPWIAYSACGI